MKFNYAVLLLLLLSCSVLNASEKPLAPSSFFIDTGVLKVRFDDATFYNMKRIEYKGKLTGVDKPGTCYGTVFKFPELGFIGSGHLDGGKHELIDSLELYVDSSLVSVSELKENSEIKAKSIKLIRKSHINGIALRTETIFAGNTIEEEVLFNAENDVKLALVYNFMHPFTTEMDQFYADSIADKNAVKFKGDGKFPFQRDARWVAFYSTSLEIMALTVITENTAEASSTVMVWDMPPRYRKFYFRSYTNSVLEKGKAVKMRAMTIFESATPANWISHAEKMAIDILKNSK